MDVNITVLMTAFFFFFFFLQLFEIKWKIAAQLGVNLRFYCWVRC